VRISKKPLPLSTALPPRRAVMRIALQIIRQSRNGTALQMYPQGNKKAPYTEYFSIYNAFK
jgi:hypothetical protein